MLCFFTIIFEVTTKVRSSIHEGKAILHKILIHYEYSHVLVLILHIIWHDLLFVLVYGINPYITFHLRCKCATSLVPVLIAMQGSVALRHAFYIEAEKRHLWKVFIFKTKCSSRWQYSVYYTLIHWLCVE